MEIFHVTIEDRAFPRFAWLLKILIENIQDPKERYYDKKLCSVRVVPENCYDLLKGCLRIIHKRCEYKLQNVKCIVTACVLSHNFCIAVGDPCLLRWKLQVEELANIDKRLDRKESNRESNSNAIKIANWIWENKQIKAVKHEF